MFNYLTINRPGGTTSPYGSLTNARYNEGYTETRYQAGITGTHFVDNALGGSHEFKTGADREDSAFLWEAFRK